jgi:glycosyltransferase involved in cell wall biosynthesis
MREWDNSSALVTAVVLTKDEVFNLERCLASLLWCREVVVVDSASTDGTQARASALGARVVERVQTGAFKIDEQRNWALQNAGIGTPWVLFIDADESVPIPLANELVRISQATDQPCDGFELTPRYLFWGTWLRRTQGYPNWHARFVRSGRPRFAGGVWEHFLPDFRVGQIAIPYDHHANSKGMSDWLKRHDRYSTWDAERTVAFLKSGDANELRTSRKLNLRRRAARLWPLRPWIRFIQMYVLRLGILEGGPAFVFCMLYFFYEWMTVVKIAELRRRDRGLPL